MIPKDRNSLLIKIKIKTLNTPLPKTTTNVVHLKYHNIFKKIFESFKESELTPEKKELNSHPPPPPEFK